MKSTFVESKKFKGYYVSKPYPEVLVSTNGVVVDAETGAPTKQYNEGGYRTTYTYCGENNRRRCVKVHRIVAHAFHALPADNKKYMVNHKDGVRYNNHHENIEWCTHAENRQHAVLNGLIQPSGKPIWVWDVLDDSKVRYVGIRECARAINAPAATVGTWPNNKNIDVFMGRYVLRFEGEEGSVVWPKIPIGTSPINKYKSNDIVAWNIKTGLKIIANSISEISKHTNTSSVSITSYMRRGHKHSLNGYVYRWLVDWKKPWPIADDVKTTKSRATGRISALNVNTQERVYGRNKTDMSKKLNICRRDIARVIAEDNEEVLNGYIFRGERKD